MAISSTHKKYQQDTSIPLPIKYTAQTLQLLSPKLAVWFTVKLFGKPLRHKIPFRELQMDRESKQENLTVPSIKKEIMVYSYGKSDKKVLLVHGWSGRGTQLAKIAEALIKNNYQTISFDAPAHGKAKGNQTHMEEFIQSILFLEKQYGPFQYAIGHSLGGMSLLNAINSGLTIKKLITIGSGDMVSDIVNDFVRALGLKPKIAIMLQEYYKDKIGKEMDSFSASLVAKNVNIPVLVVHDEDDKDVPIEAALHIQKNLEKGELYTTKGLGHKKILGNGMVIDKILQYITIP